MKRVLSTPTIFWYLKWVLQDAVSQPVDFFLRAPKQQEEEPAAAPATLDDDDDEVADDADVEAAPAAAAAADGLGAARPEPVVVITDDGRTFEAPKENLACPFCNKEYQVLQDVLICNYICYFYFKPLPFAVEVVS